MMRELNQLACSAPESYGPLKKYYLATRAGNFWGAHFYPELYFDPGSCGGNTLSNALKSL